ncbi:MAG: hypothetical protein AB7G93_12540 [Bdellovibrionales bacterium]
MLSKSRHTCGILIATVTLFSSLLVFAGFSTTAFAAQERLASLSEQSNQQWQNLLSLMISKGERLHVDRGLELRTLKHIVPEDPNVSHTADYISTRGYVDGDGVYNAFDVSVVSEDWQMTPEGYWHVDQYIFDVTLTGEMVGIHHFFIDEYPSGRVIEAGGLPVGEANSPEEQERWERKRAEWYKWSTAQMPAKPKLQF